MRSYPGDLAAEQNLKRMFITIVSKPSEKIGDQLKTWGNDSDKLGEAILGNAQLVTHNSTQNFKK